MRILAVHPGSRFSTGDVYTGLTRALKAEGHDVQEYRLDLRIDEASEFMKWRERVRIRKGDKATEGGVMPQIIRWASMTLLEAALTVNPNWILIFSAQFLHPDALRLLYRMGAPTALLLTESPYDDAMQSKLTPYAKVVFTNERASVPLLERWYEQTKADPMGVRGAKKAHYLPHAYDPTVHTPEGPQDVNGDIPSHDVVFVGSGFMERQEILQQVDWEGLGIDFGLYGIWPYVGSRNKLRKYLHAGVVDNVDTAQLYRNAKVGLNLYRQSVGTSRNATRIKDAESLNPRALELAATGTYHFSDWRPEVEEVFGSLVPTFRTAAELEKLLQIHLTGGPDSCSIHESTRQKIRERLPVAVQDWTFTSRARQVVDVLSSAQP